MTKPIVWSIAGSDSGGGAGIQADLLTCASFGVHGCTVITATTAQNSVAVKEIETIPAKHIHAQLLALQQDLPANAVKIGMLGNQENTEIISDFIKNIAAPIIFDPVLISSTGTILLEPKALNVIKKKLFPLTTLITPNIPEAEQLTKITIKTNKEVEIAAAMLLEQGAPSVLIKGGHTHGKYAQDYWTNGKDFFWLHGTRHPSSNTHGTGCAFSSAVASALALNHSLADALVLAKMYVTQGIRHSNKLGKGNNPLAHQGWPVDHTTLPTLGKKPLSVGVTTTFPRMDEEPIGFYPVIDNSEWVEKLAAIDVRTIQLRVKNLKGKELEEEIIRAIKIANHYKTRLFINDYWELAIKHKAYGVHLGQEDLAIADLATIAKAQLRLGISTHNYAEVATAHAVNPSYIAIGPIFHTNSKPMVDKPQGIAQLKRWCKTLHYPLVAIGGITEELLPDVLATGVDGIAVISAITQAEDPIATATHWLAMINGSNEMDLSLF